MQYSPNVITISITLERCFNTRGEQLQNHNSEVRKRNEILAEISRELNILFIDLNRKVEYKKTDYFDIYHFYDNVYEEFSIVIIEELFPDIVCVKSNQIGTTREFVMRLREAGEKKIYVYGNAIRGNYVKNFLQKNNFRFDGFIVSDEYAGTGNAIQFSMIEPEDALFIVTPEDVGLWGKLKAEQKEYISLSPQIYSFLQTYNMLTNL